MPSSHRHHQQQPNERPAGRRSYGVTIAVSRSTAPAGSRPAYARSCRRRQNQYCLKSKTIRRRHADRPAVRRHRSIGSQPANASSQPAGTRRAAVKRLARKTPSSPAICAHLSVSLVEIDAAATTHAAAFRLLDELKLHVNFLSAASASTPRALAALEQENKPTLPGRHRHVSIKEKILSQTQTKQDCLAF